MHSMTYLNYSFNNLSEQGLLPLSQSGNKAPALYPDTTQTRMLPSDSPSQKEMIYQWQGSLLILWIQGAGMEDVTAVTQGRQLWNALVKGQEKSSDFFRNALNQHYPMKTQVQATKGSHVYCFKFYDSHVK